MEKDYDYTLYRPPVEVDDFRSMPTYERARTPEIVDRNLSPDTFEHEFRDNLRPVVLRDALPQGARWEQWSDPDYFRERAGETEVDIREWLVLDLYLKLASETKNFLAWPGKLKKYVHRTTLNRYLDLLSMGFDSTTQIYLQNQSIPEPLEPDVEATNLSFLDTPIRSRTLFLGGQTYSDLHHHLEHDTLLCQVSGRKEVVLFPPNEHHNETLYPLRLRNFSAVRLFDVDLDQFPKFTESTPYKVVLEPGDVLYIPLPWWHSVMSLDEYVCSFSCWLNPNRVSFEYPRMRWAAVRFPRRFYRLKKADRVDVPPFREWMTRSLRGWLK